MNWVKIVNFVLLSFVFGVDGEWVEIPQSGESGHKLSIDNSMVPSDGYVVKDLNKIKYEELADIVGPGFEDEFSRFLKRHSHEASSNNNHFRGRNQSIGTTTQNALYVDPWLKYDPDYTTTPIVTSTNLWTDSAYKNASVNYRFTATTSTTIAPRVLRRKKPTTPSPRPHTTARSPHVTLDTVTGTSDKMEITINGTSATKNTNSTVKPVRNRKTNRIKWIPYNPFSFAEILNFWRNIQSTFAMGTARGIAGKIQILKKFKAELMHNIEERLKMLWPTHTEKKKRAKRGMMDGGSGTHDVSAETALMTISILTFAVFLIKLVLQVIHTIKSKHFAYNGLQTMTSQAESPIKVIKGKTNARKISFSADDDVELMAATMRAIEESPEHFR